MFGGHVVYIMEEDVDNCGGLGKLQDLARELRCIEAVVAGVNQQKIAEFVARLGEQLGGVHVEAHGIRRDNNDVGGYGEQIRVWVEGDGDRDRVRVLLAILVDFQCAVRAGGAGVIVGSLCTMSAMTCRGEARDERLAWATAGVPATKVKDRLLAIEMASNSQSLRGRSFSRVEST